MNKKISIIVPAYNIQPYIARCVKSILVQSYTDIEVVLVDDGSTDGTAQELDQLAKTDTRIKVLHQPNGGVMRARLAGVRASTGDCIGFVDGDDEIEPQMFERLVDNMQKAQADISHCGYQMVFPDGHIDCYYGTGRFVQQDHQTGISELLNGAFVEPALWNKLFKRELFDGLLNGEQEELLNIKINEDLLTNFYLFREAKSAVYEDVCPYHYVLRVSSAATSKLNPYKLKDPLRVLDILDKETQDDPEVNGFVKERIARQMIRVATMDVRGQEEFVREYRREIRARLRKNGIALLMDARIGAKVKLMVTWTAIFPSSYAWVHHMYEKWRGIDQKYRVE